MSMKKMEFSIDINAPKEEVWKVLWNDSTYREWSGAFMEGSYVESDWNEGSKIRFLDPEGNGLSSVIERKVPNQFMSFRHNAELRNKKELDEKTNWSDATESYILRQTDGMTHLKVELNGPEDHVNMFNDSFAKALQKVKELSEKKEGYSEAV